MICCWTLAALIVATPAYLTSTIFGPTSNPLAWRLMQQERARLKSKSLVAVLAARLNSFAHAARGVGHMLRNEPNARLHLVATTAVVASSAAVELDASGWRWIVAAIAAVWAAEAFNTAIETVCDMISPTLHPLVRAAKDTAAAAVFATAIGAAIIGALTFWPYISGNWDAAARQEASIINLKRCHTPSSLP